MEVYVVCATGQKGCFGLMDFARKIAGNGVAVEVMDCLAIVETDRTRSEIRTLVNINGTRLRKIVALPFTDIIYFCGFDERPFPPPSDRNIQN